MADTPRVYGTPDDDDRQPPPVQGMRGERAGQRTPVSPPRTIAGADGHPIAVQETSGIAAAESSDADTASDD